jgi:hypothetical protein
VIAAMSAPVFLISALRTFYTNVMTFFG